MRKNIKIEYIELSVSQLEPQDAELLRAAKEACATAYNPYSHFFVGAAVRMDNGALVCGSNQENIAYPSGLCAERTAMFAASAQYPLSAMTSLCIVGAECKGEYVPHPGVEELQFCAASPCGSCRQVMVEMERKGGRKMRVLLYYSEEKILIFEGAESLLPFSFSF